MASPFHRPPPFQFPRGPPSPPDTNSDSIIPGMPIPMLSSTLSLSGQDFGLHDAGLLNPNPDPRLRKSSIQYHPSGLRDNKDRASPSHLRGAKPLIIVIPPSNLLQERGQVFTAPNGPLNRLSQGIVMPLFPSMFGQLTTIAREFNFPSTSGLCLYYHYSEDGLVLTPRISDDSWQTLWGHLSDPPLPNERRPLISGKIEFDIDHRLARWYGPWVSTMHRELSDTNQLYTHTAPSHGHFRGESRTTVTDGRFLEDDAGENSAIQQHSAPITRHAPRKLSLVERFESPSARPDIRSTPRALGTPPENIPTSSQILSPIVQEDEPQSARQDLNSRVKSWRASAHLTPTPLAATGQTSLEPPNLPNSMVLNPTHEDEAEELNMDDFTWSISSAGPQSSVEMSPILWSPVPSVHLDTRLEGSVCSTPSILTSCGPIDYDDFSVEFNQPWRMSSPDIAHRLYEDRPDTPLTATTWGAPLSYPPSPLSFSRVVSPDIAQIFYENVPDTPVTATSWGAPLSYPPSPLCLSPVPSLDLGERSAFDDVHRQFNYSPVSTSTVDLPSSNRPWSHVWPCTEHNQADHPDESATSDGDMPLSSTRPWSHVWPYTQHSQTVSGESSQPSQSNTDIPLSVKPSSHVWPYTGDRHPRYREANATPNIDISSSSRQWEHVWPYTEHSHIDSADRSPTSNTDSSLSSMRPWSHVWPYTERHGEVTPAHLSHRNIANAGNSEDSLVWPHVWPYLVIEEDAAQWTLGYPYINIYRPLYPYFDIYPAIERPTSAAQLRSDVASEYPHNLLDIYPASQKASFDAYPHNLSNIYPMVPGAQEKALQKVHSNRCPNDLGMTMVEDIAGYPHNLGHIYPTEPSRIRPSEDTESYPFFDLYHPGHPPFFSHLSLYTYGPKSQYPEFEIYPELPVYASSTRVSEGFIALSSVNSAGGYPNFNLYPPVYPFFDLYPSLGDTVEVRHGGSVTTSLESELAGQYPTFNIYPAVYPHFEIYLSIVYADTASENVPMRMSEKNSATVTLSATYPFFNLYPNVYPFLEIYPASYGTFIEILPRERKELRRDQAQTLTPSLPPSYPTFNLYPSIYPYFDIYPSPYGIEAKSSTFLRTDVTIQDEPQAINPMETYPYFNIYPSVYPNFDLYPALYFEATQSKTTSILSSKPLPVNVQPVARYPVFNIYPVVYPHFNLYPPLLEVPIVQPNTNTKPSSRLTHAELHAMVMMEKIESAGPFSHMELMGHLGETETHSRSGSSSSRESEPDSRLNFRGSLASTWKTHPLIQSQENQRASKSGSASLLQGINTTNTTLFPLRSSQSPRPPPVVRQLARSGSLHEPNLPPRPTSLAQDRAPTRSHSLLEQDHSRLRVHPIPPPKTPSRKRDSIVLQRIKAYDSTVELLGGSTKDTLAKFPMPPKIPLPPLPTNRTS